MTKKIYSHRELTRGILEVPIYYIVTDEGKKLYDVEAIKEAFDDRLKELLQKREEK